MQNTSTRFCCVSTRTSQLTELSIKRDSAGFFIRADQTEGVEPKLKYHRRRCVSKVEDKSAELLLYFVFVF
jgi:hypothetical protein